MEQLGLRNEIIVNKNSPEQRIDHVKAALHELFQLLEDYAPTWYTEEHHDRAMAALQDPD